MSTRGGRATPAMTDNGRATGGFPPAGSGQHKKR